MTGVSRSWLLVLAAACGGDRSDPPEPPGSPIATPNSPCPIATAAMAHRDYPGARSAIEACLVLSPGDPSLKLGHALMDLLLFYEVPPLQDLLEICGQPTDLYDRVYGPGGEIAEHARVYDGQADLRVTWDDGGGETDLGIFDDPGYIYTRRSDSRIYVTVARTTGGADDLRLTLDTRDAYLDGSNVPITEGTVIEARGEAAEDLLWFSVACDRPGSSCNGWRTNTAQHEATIEVDRLGRDPGEPIALTVDLTIPGACDEDGTTTYGTAADCAGVHRIVGSIADVVDEEPEFDQLPFAEVALDPACGDVHCNYSTEAVPEMAAACPGLRSVDEAYGLADALADELDALADRFEEAAADPLVHWEIPHGDLFFANRPLPFADVDARALAASLTAGAAGIRLALQYETLPSTPASMCDSYVAGDVDRSDDSCSQVAYWGISGPELQAKLDPLFGELVPGADLEPGRAGLVEALALIDDVLGGDPGSEGFLDFSDPVVAEWRDAVREDLDAAVASLEGDDGPVPSQPAWGLTLGRAFDAPPEASTVRAEQGLPSLFEIYDRECEENFEIRYGVVTWFEQTGGHAFGVPRNFEDVRQPALWDERQTDRLFDVNGVPEFLSETGREHARDWFHW